jgi:hypothetical protein
MFCTYPLSFFAKLSLPTTMGQCGAKLILFAHY